MTEPIVNQYHPDFMYPPGETLKEILDERGLSEHDFAVRLGWTLKRLRAVLRGAAEITSPIAGQLEAELGVPAHFWLVHQKRYNEYLAAKALAETTWSHLVLEQGARRPLLRLLQRRFGSVPITVRDDLSTLDVDQIEGLVDVALSAHTIEEFVRRLPTQAKAGAPTLSQVGIH